MNHLTLDGVMQGPGRPDEGNSQGGPFKDALNNAASSHTTWACDCG